jgi:hypothetical protein
VFQQGLKLPVKLSYYARLLVNDRVVGTSEVVTLKEDYTLNFRDVFRWVAVLALCHVSQHGFSACLATCG